MFLSVHMTTFCQAESGWVTNAISSVLGQSHRDFEFIVYDDGSYDGTAAALDDFAKADARLRIIRGEANLNIISKSLGTCFLTRNPRAEAITWMFDDNVLQEDALAVLSEEMARSGADLVYGQTCIKVDDGKSWDIGTRTPEEIGRSFLSTSAAVPNAGVLTKPQVFERSGWYDSNIIMRRSCDWDLFKRIWAATNQIVKVDHLCATELGELSDTSLRNSFDTSFELMKKYIQIRDVEGFRLDPLATVYSPSDIIPQGDWTQDELNYIYRNFVRYFVSVGDITKGAEWANKIIVSTGGRDLLVRNLEAKFADRPELVDAVLAGLFAGRIESLPIAASVEGLSFETIAANFLRRRIKNARWGPAKAFWRMIFRTGHFILEFRLWKLLRSV